MEATGYKVFNDSVHGHITLHPLLVRVVDTPQFQRLRNLKQLGVANFVYPSAVHTRFEHSLGTCYLAGQMVEKLFCRYQVEGRTAAEEKRLALCVQLAGLCHDLGHGALSHTWEMVTKSWGDDWKHEESSVSMFDHLVKENQLQKEFQDNGLKDKEMKIIKELILGGPKKGENPTLEPAYNFLYEIVSNKTTGIDVDKWDYFLRDGLHLNLRITFDYRRLLEFCTVLKCKGGQTHIAFRDKELMTLYDMFRVRSALHYTAYKHTVVMNVELMFIDAFKIAGENGYSINNDPSVPLKEVHYSAKSMSQFTDHVYYDILYSSSKELKEARTILQRVFTRKLYKFVGKFSFKVPADEGNRKEYVDKAKLKLEQKLSTVSSEFFRVQKFYLDLDCQNDYVSKVTFYKKVRGSNTIEEQTFENIKECVDPLPFKLITGTTAVLLVFWSKEEEDKEALVKAQTIIREIGGEESNKMKKL